MAQGLSQWPCCVLSRAGPLEAEKISIPRSQARVVGFTPNNLDRRLIDSSGQFRRYVEALLRGLRCTLGYEDQPCSSLPACAYCLYLCGPHGDESTQTVRRSLPSNSAHLALRSQTITCSSVQSVTRTAWAGSLVQQALAGGA